MTVAPTWLPQQSDMIEVYCAPNLTLTLDSGSSEILLSFSLKLIPVLADDTTNTDWEWYTPFFLSRNKIGTLNTDIWGMFGLLHVFEKSKYQSI